ncbi:MAG: hypothetical protein JXR95_08450 [Deltaproteobacteria bacterium]|nr:hypothetical protein [Deltaproteobacteria bacterium]
MKQTNVILIAGPESSGKSEIAEKIGEINGWDRTVYLRQENNLYWVDSLKFAKKTISIPFPYRYTDSSDHSIGLSGILSAVAESGLFSIAIVEVNYTASLEWVLSELNSSECYVTAVVSKDIIPNPDFFSFKESLENTEKILNNHPPKDLILSRKDHFPGLDMRRNLVITGMDIPFSAFRDFQSSHVKILPDKILHNDVSVDISTSPLPSELLFPEDIEHYGFSVKNGEVPERENYIPAFNTLIEFNINPLNEKYLDVMKQISDILLKTDKSEHTLEDQDRTTDQIIEELDSDNHVLALSLALKSWSFHNNSKSTENIARCFSAMDSYRETINFLEPGIQNGDESSLRNLFRVCLAWQIMKPLKKWFSQLDNIHDNDGRMLCARYCHDTEEFEKSYKYIKLIDHISEENNYEFLLLKSDVLLMMEDYKEALEIRLKMVEMYPDDEGVLYLLGIANLAASEYEKALKNMLKALEMGNDFPSNLIGIAICMKKLNQDGWKEYIQEAFDESIESYNENPLYTVFIENYFLSLFSTGEKESAIRLLENKPEETWFSVDFLVLKEKIMEIDF